MADAPKSMTDAQRAYEQKRADKAGMSLDKWLAEKARRQAAEDRALWQLAQTDSRVMADLTCAMTRGVEGKGFLGD